MCMRAHKQPRTYEYTAGGIYAYKQVYFHELESSGEAQHVG